MDRPWRRDCGGRTIEHKPTGICSTCNRILYDSIDEKKLIICGICVQGLLGMEPERREVIREELRRKSHEN